MARRERKEGVAGVGVGVSMVKEDKMRRGEKYWEKW
jgi:hypothetical protein